MATKKQEEQSIFSRAAKTAFTPVVTAAKDVASAAKTAFDGTLSAIKNIPSYIASVTDEPAPTPLRYNAPENKPTIAETPISAAVGPHGGYKDGKYTGIYNPHTGTYGTLDDLAKANSLARASRKAHMEGQKHSRYAPGRPAASTANEVNPSWQTQERMTDRMAAEIAGPGNEEATRDMMKRARNHGDMSQQARYAEWAADTRSGNRYQEISLATDPRLSSDWTDANMGSFLTKLKPAGPVTQGPPKTKVFDGQGMAKAGTGNTVWDDGGYAASVSFKAGGINGLTDDDLVSDELAQEYYNLGLIDKAPRAGYTLVSKDVIDPATGETRKRYFYIPTSVPGLYDIKDRRFRKSAVSQQAMSAARGLPSSIGLA